MVNNAGCVCYTASVGDSRFVRAVVVFYGLMGVSGALWMWLRSEPMRRLLVPDAAPAGTLLQVVVGLGFGLAVVGSGDVMERNFAFARDLSEELARLIPNLSAPGVAIVAFFSSVGEELFFRGAMQDALGLWITALLFGIVHGFFDRRFLWWMAFALLIGIAFGVMTDWLGSLLAPTLAHFTINALNLQRLIDSRAEATP